MATNTTNGKAFEYACLEAVRTLMDGMTLPVYVSDTPAYRTAEKSFLSLSADKQARYRMAAATGIRMISGLEPCLTHGSGMLTLEIAPDAVAIGSCGDVRDVLCIRTDEWQIGMSCKHNHEALRHPRITAHPDFGTDWMDLPCSQDFFDEIIPVITPLTQCGDSGVLWRDIPSKHDDYYVPILSAFLNEIRRLCAAHQATPAKLLGYFFGYHDFYKVIMHESRSTTTVEGFNMHGTLNRRCDRVHPVTVVNRIQLPTRLIDADFGTDRNGQPSKTTMVLTFDGGWSVSMRLHNKDKNARPTSLAWDVTLIGLPPRTYVNTRGWDE